jgi:hypothetical protein
MVMLPSTMPHHFCHSERSEESLFDLRICVSEMKERFLASLGMTKWIIGSAACASHAQ